jgi:hypothetical protein
MILSLSSNLKKAQGSVRVNGGRGQHFKESGLVDVIGARTGHEHTARPQHFQSAEIQFLVAAESGVEIPFGFGESGRWLDAA